MDNCVDFVCESPGQGEGHGRCAERDVVKSIVVENCDMGSNIDDCTVINQGIRADNDLDSGICHKSENENCGLPAISHVGLRQSAIRLHKKQDGYSEVEVILRDTLDWENLPDYVGLTSDVSICQALADKYDCGVPIMCIEVVPGSFIPVFHHCLAGMCRCVYILQGAVTQLRPCQFATYLYKFDSVSKRDWYVLTSVCRGVRIVDKDFDKAYYCENYASVTKGQFKDEMTEKILSELEGGKICQVAKQPRCVHSLGG